MPPLHCNLPPPHPSADRSSRGLVWADGPAQQASSSKPWETGEGWTGKVAKETTGPASSLAPTWG
eukprot:6804451-Alexandrium_andersonii.AAC.1